MIDRRNEPFEFNMLRAAAGVGALSVLALLVRERGSANASGGGGAVSWIFWAALVGCDIALMSASRQRPRSFALGFAVPSGLVLSVAALFLLVAPGWYGLPPIVLLGRDHRWLALVAVSAIVSRVAIVVTAVRVRRYFKGEDDGRWWLLGVVLSTAAIATPVLRLFTANWAR